MGAMNASNPLSKISIFRSLDQDGRLLFITRGVRRFAYGFLSVVLVLYLTELGLSETKTGLLLSLTLVGDTLVSLWITTHADRLGRRLMLKISAILMLFAGILFVATQNFYVLLLAATIGVISPSGYEVGPFLSIEQASLAQLIGDRQRTHMFAWYNLVGSFTTALGALSAGWLSQGLHATGISLLNSYRAVILGYAGLGLALLFLFSRLTAVVEADHQEETIQQVGLRSSWLGLRRSRAVVLRLSGLFIIDAFAGGFLIQSFVAYWFHVRFGVEPGLLGSIFFATNILAGLSALSAAWVAGKIGLVNTMVFTHLPSNILLILIPLMPGLGSAIVLLLARYSISQMDVPTRQSYIMAVVDTDERSSAAGVTSVARTVGASLAPIFAGFLYGNPLLLNAPFFVAGGLKIIYDLGLYRSFRGIKPPEERSN
jgi:MFS family permease